VRSVSAEGRLEAPRVTLAAHQAGAPAVTLAAHQAGALAVEHLVGSGDGSPDLAPPAAEVGASASAPTGAAGAGAAEPHASGVPDSVGGLASTAA